MRSLVPLTSEPSEYCICHSFLRIHSILKSRVPHQVQLCVVFESKCDWKEEAEGRLLSLGRCGPRPLAWELWPEPCLGGASLKAGCPVGQGCLCSTPLPDTASHSELAGFAEGSSSQPVWSSYFRRFDLARSKQKPCAIKIEIFSKLYSGLLEIMITDKLHYPKNSVCTEV